MKEKIGLWVIAIAIIVFAIYASGYFSFVYDLKTQLKQEYTTEWADAADGMPASGGSSGVPSYSDSKFDCKGNVIVTSYGIIQLGASSTAVDSYCALKRNFYGKEVAIIAGGWDVAYFDVNGEKIDTNVQTGDTFGSPELFILKPHTTNINLVDVILNNLVIRTISVDNPEIITFHSGVSRSKSYMSFSYLGYKAQYSCDLAPDEVWIQEAFAQPFGIKDLSFPVTKLCKETRPFVLRNIQQGEAPYYPNPIPAFNRGEMLDVPAGSIGVVNYATPNVAGVTNKCDVDQANIKVAGKWVCSQVIRTTTITREVPVREIVQVSGVNQFAATKNFNIGNSAFTQSQRFDCQIPAGTDIARFPQPSSDCYSSFVDYDGKQFMMKDKQLAQFNDYVSLQYFANGEITQQAQKFSGIYIFNVKNPFAISLDGGLTFKQGNKGTISLKITNNLPPSSITLRISQKVAITNQNLPETIATLNAVKDINDFNFDIDTINLGINEVTVQAFYPINADGSVLIPSDITKINVEVRGTEPSIIKFVEVEKPVYVNIQQPSFLERIISFFRRLFNSIFG